jgi:Domain of unknown function (DUF929)
MVDWDQVEKDRDKGWGWDKIAADPKVSFHADSDVGSPGRALRALYYRRKSRESRKPSPKSAVGDVEDAETRERKWNLIRIGYFAAPILLIWLALAYVAPSPVGLIVPAFPWLALAAAVAAFALAFGLWRASGPRWNPILRRTLVSGVVVGFVISGMIGLTGVLAFGCPYLPPSSSLTTQPGGQGWASAPVAAWHSNGLPVIYFYGASWCPYCSASSWAIWKALTEFGTVSGASPAYSSTSDVYPGTPEMVLASASVNSNTIHPGWTGPSRERATALSRRT